jgi:hypothetical protein
MDLWQVEANGGRVGRYLGFLSKKKCSQTNVFYGLQQVPLQIFDLANFIRKYFFPKWLPIEIAREQPHVAVCKPFLLEIAFECSAKQRNYRQVWARFLSCVTK